MPNLRPAGQIRPAEVSNPARERILRQLFEIFEFWILYHIGENFVQISKEHFLNRDKVNFSIKSNF